MAENDANFTPEGTFQPTKRKGVTREAQDLDSRTKGRRAQPVIKSGFEDSEKNFYPAYGRQQILRKQGHIVETL